ncbi:MAG TPA: VWA domain-containing protein [Burkholderiales bacterium]|nr:VWA domain-containing protein [Burkholderiales bacterium]
MTFLWPEFLWLLLLVPAIVALYFYALRGRKKSAVRLASLSLVREAAAPAWRRHVPPAMLLVALAVMIAAIARPAAVITLPSSHETVILAIDVSASMRANDVEPSRIEAAQAAARAFVNEQPRSTRIGIVAFAGSAALVQPPTANRRDVLLAIDQLQLQHATAIGSGLLVSLKAIFPDVPLDLPRQRLRSAAAGASSAREPAAFRPVPPGSYAAGAIVLLTDGQTTTGPDPVEAARLAAERGVRVFTVGVGTDNGQILTGEGWSMRVRLDEEPLRAIADLTRAEYFYAGTAVDLKKVYQSLRSKLVLEKKETEITSLFSALAAATVLLSATLSLLWFNRVL